MQMLNIHMNVCSMSNIAVKYNWNQKSPFPILEKITKTINTKCCQEGREKVHSLVKDYMLRSYVRGQLGNI